MMSQMRNDDCDGDDKDDDKDDKDDHDDENDDFARCANCKLPLSRSLLSFHVKDHNDDMLGSPWS